MVKLKVLLNVSILLYFAAAHDVPLRASQPIFGVPRPKPRPSLVRPVTVATTETPIIEELPQTTLAPKPIIIRSPEYAQPSSIYPHQRVNLHPNYAPPAGAYTKPISVTTLPPPTEAPVEQFAAPVNDELPAEDTQVVSSTILPVEPEVVITEITLPPETEAPVVTEPNPGTTILESQSIVIKPRPTVSDGLEWGGRLRTLEELAPAPPAGAAPRPYQKPITVTTLPLPTEAPVEQFAADVNGELPAEDTQFVSSTILPEEPEVVITEMTLPPETEAPVVTEPNPGTTILESQSIVIKPLPTVSGLDWGRSQSTLEELAPAPVPTAFPIKAPPKPRPTYPVKSKRVRPKQLLKPVIATKLLPKPRPATLSGTRCAAENGYFPIGQDCDAYIECKKTIPTEFICPDGLHFNPEAVWPNYPCGYPSEVHCGGRTLEHEPHPTEECPRQYGFFPMDSTDCSKYIMCQEGKATIMNCPPGLAFSVAVDSCDWPVNVPTCNPGVFQGFQCPEPPLDEDGRPSDLITHYKYGDSCKSYVACQRGRPRLLSCDEGLSFDNMSARCIDSDYVKNCEL